MPGSQHDSLAEGKKLSNGTCRDYAESSRVSQLSALPVMMACVVVGRETVHDFELLVVAVELSTLPARSVA